MELKKKSSNESSGSDTYTRRQRYRGKPTGSGGGKPNAHVKKFAGVNQDEMKGVVISLDGSIDTSQQYESFMKTLLVLAGKCNPDVRSALEYSTPLVRESLYADKPKKSIYTMTVGDVEMEDEDKKEMLMELWREDNKRAAKRYERYADDLKKIYSVITGQLCDGITKELKAKDEWKDINIRNDPIDLMTHLKEICYRDSETKTNPALDLINKAIKFLTSRQDHGKDASKFTEEVKVKYDVFKANGGSLVSERLIKYTLKRRFKGVTFEMYEAYEDDSNEKILIEEAAEEMLIANVIIRGSSSKTHRGIAGVLQDDYSRGTDTYPTSSARALMMLNQYTSKGKGRDKSPGNRDKGPGNRDKGPGGPKSENKDKESAGTAFATKASNGDRPTDEEAHQLLMKGIDEEDVDEAVCFAHFAEEITEHSLVRTSGERRSAKSRSAKSRSANYRGESQDVITEFTHSEEIGHVFSTNAGGIDENWLLLDSQANLHVVSNPKLLRNIRKHPNDRRIRVHCNAGDVTVDTVGDMPGFGTVWFYRDGIANILSLGLLSEHFRVTMDTSVINSLFVHKPDGGVREFHRSSCNLYVCDLKAVTGTLLTITTVEGKKALYSDLDIRRAEKARKVQDTMVYPSLESFLHMIDNNLIMNCPVTRRDVLIAEDVFGKNTNIIKGKSVRRQPKQTREDLVAAPPEILRNYGDVTLCIDIVSVNGVKLFRSISKHIHFRTCKAVTNVRKSTLLQCVKAIIGIYAKRGFTVTQIYGDNEFECLSEDLLTMRPAVSFFPVAKGCHEPYVERDNRTFKERMRCIYAGLPFNRIPERMIIEMGHAVTLWLNYWCNSTGISKTISPRELVTGIRLDANKHLKFQFGDYVLGHEEDTDNGMEPRAIDGIYLRPTGNPHGGFYLYDLKTGRRVHRKRATGAHMTTTVIQRVEAIAIGQQAPDGLLFGDADGKTTILDLDTEELDSEDDVTDDEYDPNEDNDPEDESLVGVIDDNEPIEEDDNDNIDNENNDDDPIVIQGGANPEHETDGQEINDTVNQNENGTNNEVQGEQPRTDNANTNDNDGTEGRADDEGDASNESGGADETVENPRRVGLRPSVTFSHNKYSSNEGFESTTRQRCLFTAGFGAAIDEIEKEDSRVLLAITAVDQYNNIDASLATKQYGVNMGLKMFGEDGSKAVYNELKQLHDRRVISPRAIKDLTPEQRQRALPYLMFLKRKRCGKIKGRGCADGRSQREYISKEEASSPTVSLQALMLSCVIDAIEGRDVATADVPGAFLQTDMPADEEDVHIRIDGKMAELLARIDPELYNQCMVTTRNGKKIIYAKAEKAIYGTLKAALLFWQKLSGKLEDWGFIRNPYDMCTMNRMINGKQCTIVWHVDDLKISHVDSGVVVLD